MADLISALDHCDFEISDGAASAGSFAAITPVGLPDTTDVAGIVGAHELCREILTKSAEGPRGLIAR
jgi:hypothetical protein